MVSDFAYRKVTGTGIGYEELSIVKNNFGIGLEGELTETYKLAMLSALVVILPIFLAFMFLFFKAKKIFHLTHTITLFCISLIAIYGILKISNANRLSFPSPMRFTALTAYIYMNDIYSGKRDDVTMNATQDGYRHIVFLVDESIRGDLLQINGFQKETSPYLKKHSEDYINLGLISSTCVCSDYANISLISGIRENQIPDKQSIARKSPTLFQYAKKAGYFTSFIYPLGMKDKPKGYMTQDDDNIIDNKILVSQQHPELKQYQLDDAAIAHLKEAILSHSKTFTYLIKVGAHFHYESSYPDTSSYFLPTQDPDDWRKRSKQEMENSYFNALRWTTDRILKKLMEELKGQEVIFIYTSDHGQNIMDDPKISLTHCAKSKAPKVMAEVPLLFFSPNSTMQEDLKSKLPISNVNKGSHFELFPSLLNMMGYDSIEVKNKYGLSYFDSLPQRQRHFFSGDLFGRGSFYSNDF